jgi:hypothetical protein
MAESKPAAVPDDERPDESYDMRIARDGTWYYHGSPIQRPELVRLFATVLRRDDAGDYWLVTPAERGRIQVEDAPFVAVELSVRGSGRDQELIFRTNLDHEVIAGPEHPIRVEVDHGTGEPRPYILVRDKLDALIHRSVFYDLVERGEVRVEGGESQLGIWTKGTFFTLGNLPDD